MSDESYGVIVEAQATALLGRAVEWAIADWDTGVTVYGEMDDEGECRGVVTTWRPEADLIKSYFARMRKWEETHAALREAYDRHAENWKRAHVAWQLRRDSRPLPGSMVPSWEAAPDLSSYEAHASGQLQSHERRQPKLPERFTGYVVTVLAEALHVRATSGRLWLLPIAAVCSAEATPAPLGSVIPALQHACPTCRAPRGMPCLLFVDGDGRSPRVHADRISR